MITLQPVPHSQLPSAPAKLRATNVAGRLAVVCLLALSGCADLPIWRAGPAASKPGSTPAVDTMPAKSIPESAIQVSARQSSAMQSSASPDNTAPGELALGQPLPASDVTAADATPLSEADRAEIRRLLRSADYAITDGNLIEPADYNATLFYQRVLAIDPANPAARYGLEGVVDRLIDRAMAAADQGRFDDARTLLEQALAVDPDHTGVRPALTRIGMLKTARRNVFRLDPKALDARSAGSLATIREAGQASRSPGCRAVINARSDAEGRFIYQEMSAAPGKDRIRAELRIARSPNIENICFPGAE